MMVITNSGAAYKKREKAVLVGLNWQEDATAWSIEETMEELEQLARSCGSDVAAVLIQPRSFPERAWYIGRGKVEELSLLCQEVEADLVIFAAELSPLQLRNLERLLPCPVIDRTQLILDIFAQRARSREGKIQVELAQLRYLLPRLAGRGVDLSRLGGTIGTRGPGETKLEMDRRRIRQRLQALERKVREIVKQRQVQRQQRQKGMIPLVSLVGYTNAGKSTLLRSLSGAEVLVADQLFATLDPTTRRVSPPGGREFLVTDTVGFIHRLPPQLVAAFRSTLEEIGHSDLLVEVVDSSHPRMLEQHEAVCRLLEELDMAQIPRLTVLNKIDRLGGDHGEANFFFDEVIPVSALTGQGIPQLITAIAGFFQRNLRRVRVLLPYSASRLRSYVYQRGLDLHEEYLPEGILLEGELDGRTLSMVKEYIFEGL